jgi:2,5-dihydroxypyridine 5,6-dioxygenase
MTAESDLIALFREELKLCAVGPGQEVAVLSEGAQLQDYAEASRQAASELGAKVTFVNVPADKVLAPNERMANIGQNGLSRHPWAMEACKRADLVVDHMLLLFSREQIEMQAAGSRVLLVVEPREILERLFPSAQLRRRVESAEQYLAAAKRLRFVNDAGTDVVYQLGEKGVLTEYGFTETPGRWDHWPGGFLATLAASKGVNGRVVMDRGDLVFPQRTYVEEPIEFVIRDGAVIEINGGPDAASLREFMDGYKDPRAYAVSHIGWGLNERCQWDPTLPGIGMDGRAHYGNVLFSLGPDTEFGGDNDTACHLDLPMRNCTLWLDDKLIVEDGELVPADLQARN